MLRLKLIFTFLILLRTLPRLSGYRFRSPETNEWQPLAANIHYDEEGNNYFGDYDSLASNVAGTGGNGARNQAGGCNTGGDCNGGTNGGAANGVEGCAGSDGDDLSKACTKCDVNALSRGEAKMTATGFALKSAQEAKAANDAQVPAAEAASFQAKCELAGKAIQSAKGAEAVLAGKQEILEQARMLLADAEAEVARLTASLRCLTENAEIIMNAVQDLTSMLSHVRTLLHEATKNLGSIQSVARGAQQELAEKTQILKAAKFRAESLNRQLTDAKADFDKTKMAAYKAVCAAVEAKQKAQRAKRLSWMNLDDDWDTLAAMM